MVGHLAGHLLVTPPRRLLVVPPTIFLAVFFVLPVAVALSVFLRIDVLLDTVTDPFFARIAWFSLWQAAASTLLTLVIGLPVTWSLSRYRFALSGLVRGVVMAPFVLPAVVVAAGVFAVLPQGRNTGLVPILWAHVLFNISVIVRLVGPRWEMLDHRLEEASALLGARAARTFIHVTWPHIRNATMNAALIVFMYCFTSFGVIVIVGGFSRRTLEAEIFTQAIRLGDTATATALALVQIAIIAIVVVMARIVQGPEPSAGLRGGRRALSSRPRHRWWVPASSVVGVLVVIAPLVAALFRSVHNSATGAFTLAGWRSLVAERLPGMSHSALDVVSHSAGFAVVAAVICVPLSLAVVVGGGRFIMLLSSTPLVVSAATLGVGLVITFDVDPVMWRSQWWLLPVVHAAIAFPLVTRTLGPAYGAIDDGLRRAAAVLGASPVRTFTSVELPVLASALRRAFGLSVALSLGEFGATSFLTRSDTTTIPIAIGELFGKVGQAPQQAGFALSAVFIIATVGVMSRA